MKRRFLIGLQLFNALTASIGGLVLMAGLKMPAEWLSTTSFNSYYFPGVILFAAVGGSALIASIGIAKKMAGSALMSLAAGVIMLYWIIGEIVSIHQFHWLQGVYVATAVAIVYLSIEK